MKTLKFLLICAVALMTLAGCESDELDEAYYASHATITSSDPNFTSDSDGGTIHFNAEGGEVTILVSCGTAFYTHSVNFDCRFEFIENSCYLTVVAEQNLFLREKTGTITLITAASLIEFATITVTQDGLAYINLSDEELLLSNSKGSISVNVESNFEWTYNCDADWLTITRPTSGGTMKIAYTANATGIDRETVVTVTAGDGASNVAEAELKITQSLENIDALILEYTVTDNNATIYLPICDVTNASIDWDDGTTTTASYDCPSHTYSTPGIYTVTINGTVKSLSYSYTASSKYLTAVKQWGNTGLTYMANAFDCCYNLTSLPKSASSFSDVKTFRKAFYRCSSLEELPEDLFSNCPVVTSFESCFSDCSSLTSVPKNTFSNCPAVTTFHKCFYGCSSLISVPENIFSNCPVVTSFESCFFGCSSLTSVPENIFTNCQLVTNFGYCFNGCSSLISVPENIFSNRSNVTTFYRAFYNCSSLVSAPSFANCSAVTTFEDTFNGCASLATVPENIFTNCTAATTFGSCFYGCSNLKSVPINMFDGILNIADFSKTFHDCSSVVGESPYTVIEVGGETVNVHIYDRSDYAAYMRYYIPTSYKNCFTNSTFSDIDSIPSSWGGNGN